MLHHDLPCIRGTNQLAHDLVASDLIETIKHRNATIVSKWKEWTAKALKIEWQRDFFEHRPRKEESFREKADYILANPVRAGFVKQSEDWPYVLIAKQW